jgi:hypothetical protein
MQLENDVDKVGSARNQLENDIDKVDKVRKIYRAMSITSREKASKNLEKQL